MFKKLCLKVLRFVAVTLLLVNVTLSVPVFAQIESTAGVGSSPASETLDTPSDRSGESTPSDQSIEETHSNIERSDKPRSAGRTYATPPDPYNMEAIEKFDEELYGPEH